MKKFLTLGVLAAGMLLGACDDVGLTTSSGAGVPSAAQFVGVWTGTEEITTVEDISLNTGASPTGERGFSFPVALQLGADGRFMLYTSGAVASGFSCRGLYQKRGNTIEFFTTGTCKALPLTRYTIGGVLPRGIVLDANTMYGPNAYTGAANIRVRFRLDR